MSYPTQPQISVRTLPWLAVITKAGQEHLGLEDVLLRAHEIQRIDVADPLARHAILQFLVSVTALIGRELDLDSPSAAAVARSGFTAESVQTVLDRLDHRLWLIHPETPFMQEKRFIEVTERSGRSVADAAIHAAAIDSAVPGASSKSWWNVPGDEFRPTGLTPIDAVPALLKVWFHSPGGKAAIGPFGSRTALGSTLKVQTFLWWRGGDSLAHLLLANLDEGWLEGEELPGWAQDLDSIAGPHPSFVQSTQHCSAALLLPREQEPDAPVYFEQALYGGSPRVGLDAANKNDVTAAKAVWKDHIDAAALGNPRVPRFVDPKTSVVRAGFGLSPELAHLQNLLSWYRQNRRPELARGVLRAHDGQLDALVLDVKLSGSYPEIKQAVWFALGREFADLTDEQYNRMTSYLEDIPNNAQMRLTYAVRGALPRAPKSAQDAIAEAVIERFYIDAESALEAAFSSVLEGAPYSPDTVATLRTLMVGAFNHVLAPYISVRTLADIAHEGGVLARAHLGPAPEKASAKGKK